MGAAALIAMMDIVFFLFSLIISLVLAAFVIGGIVYLPTGSEFFSIFPVVIGGISGSNTPLFAFLLPLLFAYLCVVVFVVVLLSLCAGGKIPLSLGTFVVAGVGLLLRR